MPLNLAFDFQYQDRPNVPVRLRLGDAWVDTTATLDTGAAITLFDETIAPFIGLSPSAEATRRVTLVGVGGAVERVPCWMLTVSILPEVLNLTTTVQVGLVPQLAKLTGNLLGRDFLEAFHFGLAHRQRLVYLGVADSALVAS